MRACKLETSLVGEVVSRDINFGANFAQNRFILNYLTLAMRALIQKVSSTNVQLPSEVLCVPNQILISSK
jgi:hypothetical protein